MHALSLIAGSINIFKSIGAAEPIYPSLKDLIQNDPLAVDPLKQQEKEILNDPPQKQIVPGNPLKDVTSIAKAPLFNSTRYSRSFVANKFFIEAANKPQSILSDCLTDILTHPNITEDEATNVIKKEIKTHLRTDFKRYSKTETANYSGPSNLIRITYITGFYGKISKEDENIKNGLEFLTFIIFRLKNLDHEEVLPYAGLSLMLRDSFDLMADKYKNATKKPNNEILGFKDKILVELQIISDETNKLATTIEDSFKQEQTPSSDADFLSKYFTTEIEESISKSMKALENIFDKFMAFLGNLDHENEFKHIKQDATDSIVFFQAIDLILDFLVSSRHFADYNGWYSGWSRTNRFAKTATDLALSLIIASLKPDQNYYDKLKITLSKNNFDWWHSNNLRTYFNITHISSIHRENILEELKDMLIHSISSLNKIEQDADLRVPKTIIDLFRKYCKLKEAINELLEPDQRASLRKLFESFEEKIGNLKEPEGSHGDYEKISLEKLENDLKYESLDFESAQEEWSNIEADEPPVLVPEAGNPSIENVGEPLVKEIEKLPEMTKKGIENTADTVKETVKDAVGEAGNVIEDAVDKTENVIEDVVDDAGKLVEDTFDKAGDVIEDTFDETGKLVENLVYTMLEETSSKPTKNLPGNIVTKPTKKEGSSGFWIFIYVILALSAIIFGIWWYLRKIKLQE